MNREAGREQRVVGRYMLCDEIAAGGMATVHIGRLLGPVGFARTVAIKRLHAHFAKDPEFVAMFLDEARIAARVRHPNVASTLDVVVLQGEMLVVMEYVHGEPLSRLVRASRAATGRGVPPPIALSVIAGALYGLHAAHEARDDHGAPLEIVHRDVSPQNILVGQDGIPRVVDFGVAKATGRMQSTREGALKGKIAYMSPEQVASDRVDRRTDVYAASVVLWEMLAGQRLFSADNEVHVLNAVLHTVPQPPSRFAPGIPEAIDSLVLKGLSRDPAARFATAAEMAEAAQQLGFATPGQIANWVKQLGGATLDQRAARVVEIESTSSAQGPRSSMVDDNEATIVRELPPAPAPVPSAPPPVERPPPAPSFGPPPPAFEAQGSQVSSVNVASPMPPRSRAPLVIAALAPVVVAALLVGAFLILRSRPAADATASQPGESAAPPATERAATEKPIAPAPTPQPVAEPAPTPQPVAEPAIAPPEPLPTATAIASTIATAAPRASATAAAAAKPAKKPNCSPPYRIDARGVRVPKLECL